MVFHGIRRVKPGETELEIPTIFALYPDIASDIVSVTMCYILRFEMV